MARRTDEIALNERLTKQVLLREIFAGYKNTIWIRKKKRLVIWYLECILSEQAHLYDENYIIYCFLRLWEENRVYNLGFRRAWYLNIIKIWIQYRDWYDEHIKKRQEELLIM